MESILLILVALLLIIGFCYYENNVLSITRINLKMNINNSVKIVHLSDIHSKVFGKGNKTLINKIKKLSPDLILITGDLINMDGRNINEMLGLLTNLNNIASVYYILGNHENRLSDLGELVKRIENTGVKVLIDKIDSIKVNNIIINLLGLNENQASRDDYHNRKKGIYLYNDYKSLFNKLESLKGIKIVMSHYPENFSLIGKCSYNNYNFDLMLSGHAHGGQFRLPFIGGLYAPGQGIFPKYTAGLHNEKTNLIISKGIGPSRFPLRLFNRPEIIVVNINNYN